MDESGKNPFKDKKGPPLPDQKPSFSKKEEIDLPEPRPGFSEQDKSEPKTTTLPPPPVGIDSIDAGRRDLDFGDEEMEPKKILLIGAAIAAAIAVLVVFLFSIISSPEVGVSQIEDGSVTTPKIANQAVTVEKLADGTAIEGPRGPVGPRGPAGPTGPAGKAIASGLSGVEFINDVSPTDSAIAKSFNLNCPTGKKILSGGAEVISGNESVVLASSIPTDDGAAWSARAVEIEPFSGKWFISINLTCAKIDN